MHIPIGERRGLEWRVHVNETTTRFPSAKGDATLGFVRGSLDVFEVAAQSRCGGGVGASLFEVFQALVATLLPFLSIPSQDNDLHRHGGAKQGDLPRLGSPHDQGGSPKLRWQLTSQLPTQSPNHKSHQLDTPCCAIGAGRGGVAMGACRGVSHVPQVRLQSPSNFLLAWGLCAEISRAGSGNPHATRIARPTKRGDRS